MWGVLFCLPHLQFNPLVSLVYLTSKLCPPSTCLSLSALFLTFSPCPSVRHPPLASRSDLPTILAVASPAPAPSSLSTQQTEGSLQNLNQITSPLFAHSPPRPEASRCTSEESHTADRSLRACSRLSLPTSLTTLIRPCRFSHTALLLFLECASCVPTPGPLHGLQSALPSDLCMADSVSLCKSQTPTPWRLWP